MKNTEQTLYKSAYDHVHYCLGMGRWQDTDNPWRDVDKSAVCTLLNYVDFMEKSIGTMDNRLSALERDYLGLETTLTHVVGLSGDAMKQQVLEVLKKMMDQYRGALLPPDVILTKAFDAIATLELK